MNPNFCTRNCRLLVLFVFICLVNIKSFSQVSDKIDFKYSVDSVKVGDSFQFNIKISAVEGNGPFIVAVYENLKQEMIELDKKENVTDSGTTLSFIGRKACVIYIRNQATGVFKTLIY